MWSGAVRAVAGRWLPGPELAGVVVGQGRLGVGLLSLIATLREELRLPIGAIQWYLEAVHGLRLSVGAIVGALHTVAQRADAAGRPACGRRSAPVPVLHVDETGWREDGHNGYVWTFSTATARRLRARQPRQRAVLEAGDRHRLRRRAGQRLLRRLHHLRRAAPILLGASAARCG